jgi:hypothetical protein
MPNDRLKMQSKVKYQVSNVQQEIKVILVTNNRLVVPSKVNVQVTKVQQGINGL